VNAKQRKVSLVAVVAVAGLLARYFSYPDQLRPLHDEWLSLAILAAAVGASALVWFSDKRS
jgi:hypothetical protein